MGALLEPFFYIIGFVVDIYFKVVVVEIVLHWLPMDVTSICPVRISGINRKRLLLSRPD